MIKGSISSRREGGAQALGRRCAQQWQSNYLVAAAVERQRGPKATEKVKKQQRIRLIIRFVFFHFVSINKLKVN